MSFSKYFRALLLHRGVMTLGGMALGCVLHAQAHADVWKYVDKEGVTRFTNEPPNQGAQRLFQSDPELPSPAARASEPTPAPAPASAPARVPASAPIAAPEALPINPAKALGDWPPKPLILKK